MLCVWFVYDLNQKAKLSRKQDLGYHEIPN